MSQNFAYFIGYNDDQDVTPASLADTCIDVLLVAFANLTSDSSGSTIDMGPSSLTKCYSEEVIKEGIQAFHDKGKKVLLSINDNGGKGPVTWGNANPSQLASNIVSIVNDWGFDGVDLDNEDVSSSSSNFASIVGLLRQQLPSDHLLTAPVYSGNQGNLDLGTTATDFNYLLTMNYFAGCAGIEAYAAELAGLYGYSKIVLGVGVPGATSPGQETPVSCISQFKKITVAGGIMIWAANYSQASPYIDALCS